MARKKDKRKFQRVDRNRDRNRVTSVGEPRLKKLKAEQDTLSSDFAEAIAEDNRVKAQNVLSERDNLNRDAMREFKKRDRTTVSEAFLPLTESTKHYDERIVDRSMSVGTTNYDKYLKETPDNLKDLSTTDLAPDRVQEVAVSLIVSTRNIVAREGFTVDDVEKEVFKGIPPISDDPKILELINELTPNEKSDLEDDVRAFYTYLSINHPGGKDFKIVGPPLAKAYLDYRAMLVTLSIRSR